MFQRYPVLQKYSKIIGMSHNKTAYVIRYLLTNSFSIDAIMYLQ